MRLAAFTPLCTLKLMSTLTSVRESVSLMIGTYNTDSQSIKHKQQTTNNHKDPMMFIPLLCRGLWWCSHLQPVSCVAPLQESREVKSPSSQTPPSLCHWLKRSKYIKSILMTSTKWRVPLDAQWLFLINQQQTKWYFEYCTPLLQRQVRVNACIHPPTHK